MIWLDVYFWNIIVVVGRIDGGLERVGQWGLEMFSQGIVMVFRQLLSGCKGRSRFEFFGRQYFLGFVMFFGFKGWEFYFYFLQVFQGKDGQQYRVLEYRVMVRRGGSGVISYFEFLVLDRSVYIYLIQTVFIRLLNQNYFL